MINFFNLLVTFRYQIKNFYLIKIGMVRKKYLLVLFFFSHRNIVKI